MPLPLAPRDEATGGFLFLPNDTPTELVDGLIAIAGLAGTEYKQRNQYGLQLVDAPEGMEADLGYLRKLIIADRFALRFLFGSISDSGYETKAEQPLTIAELVEAFFADERARYGTSFNSPLLAGRFGGDGNLRREQLGFGFAVENAYYGVISVWSRGWLVTK